MWILLQQYFYHIHTEYDETSPSMEILLNELQQ